MTDQPDDQPNPDQPGDPFASILGEFLASAARNATGPAEVEPNADLMNMAHHLFEQYTAYQRAGFDVAQSFALIRTALNAFLTKGPGD